MKVIIVGAGVNGMMLSRELALSGVEVVLLDKGLCCKEASWAGGGIVSPLYPWRYPDAVSELARWSQHYYPNLAESLEAESGIDPELSRHGLMMLDTEERDSAIAWAQRFGASLAVIDEEMIQTIAPGLHANFKQAIWMPQVASIRNPRLGRSLRESIEREPLIDVREQQSIQHFLTSEDGSEIKGVMTANESIVADKVVICAGAWTAQLLEPLGLQLPIKPIKGEMILVKTSPGTIKSVVMNNGQYVIPRRDGCVLVGSTVEDVGFDKQATAQARDSLRQAMVDMFPDLAHSPVEHHWAGLRPGSPDGIPFIGSVPGVNNLYVNAGQFRKGLVLAPASCRLMADLVLEIAPCIDPKPYALEGRDTN